MGKLFLALFLALLSIGFSSPGKRHKTIPEDPVIDLDGESTLRVVVDGRRTVPRHPATVLLEDGKTILTVYPKGHGKGAIVYKKALTADLRSDRIPVPESWKTSLEVPTIFRSD
jgi:hypothetical protein